MLELKEIKKVYPTGFQDVEALKGVSLQFRKNEFVSILGPSGCGKTTLLNIIGGLDSYTDGDLFINNISTKNYKDRDWDAYRNHSVGFVFQNYNLIPHQTVLGNVELALTLSGVSKKERTERAKEALRKVGLEDQLKKHPAEMSGGQMQRVAIARAIVNNPDIILADEPTGALDTKTSVQVMEILKEISKECLVIMVTHNPDLAEQYSTRLVKMLDGQIVSDSKPLSEEELKEEIQIAEAKEEEAHKKKKPSMSFFTSFGLSLRNLFTKKGRTILVSFAGSIGIIGIALIYAVSQGTTLFIDSVQEDTLSSYPLSIQAQSMDMSTLLETFTGKAQSIEEHENDAVYKKTMVYEMVNALNSMEAQKNDLKSFKAHIEKERQNAESPWAKALSGVQYTYDTDLLIYTKAVDGNIVKSDTQDLMNDLMKEYMGMDMDAMQGTSYGGLMGGSIGGGSRLWKEIIPGDDGEPVSALTKKQYDLVHGEWPKEYNEIVLFLDERNELNDVTLYALGLIPKEEMDKLMEASVNGDTIEYEAQKWSYEEICNMEFRTILNTNCYEKDPTTGLYKDLRDTEAGLKYLYDNGMPLKVTGIVRPAESAVSTSRQGSIGYTCKLIEYMSEQAKNAEIVKDQMNTPEIDVFTGLHFKDKEGKSGVEEKAQKFRDYVDSCSDEEKAKLFVSMKSIPAKEDVEKYIETTLGQMTRQQMEMQILQTMTKETGMDAERIQSYVSGMSDEELRSMFHDAIAEQYKKQYAAQVVGQMAGLPMPTLLQMFEKEMGEYEDAQMASYYDEVLEFSDSDYETNLTKMGYIDLDSPHSINLYSATFEDKDVIEDAIQTYNESVEDLEEIQYTDYVGIIMSSVTTIIDAITYVLIAFVAVSLIVSSIMIGVITLISVQERTKEIGILRAIGASKKNVSSMFNAETMIIGFTSGLLGVLITYLLCIPINMILHYLTDLENLNATLPLGMALILIAISTVLTLIAGIIPSRSAAKKDPVVALRTE